MKSDPGACPVEHGEPGDDRPRASAVASAGGAFGDPLSELPETAQKLLLAAKRIIAADGFSELTLNAVAAQAGENKAMISYYFGNKAGLVAAVLDSVIHDEYVVSRERMRDLDPEQRREQLVAELRHMSGAAEEFLVFFELLPHVLRDEGLRRRIAELYRWYWDAKLEWLGVGAEDAAGADAEMLGLSQVLSAVIDGLALQAAIDPELDLSVPYRVFGRMLAGAVALPNGTARGATRQRSVEQGRRRGRQAPWADVSS
ncbi:MAG: TetR/AcrR family transcriptional regulator [Thermoleophilia bacterium]|jgi:AcrR family transcriptional regulator|nr:TetR/AcrR family transcriptional regulator [Thermoleophilia bacterium]